MITIFNRRELMITFSMSKQYEVRAILENNNIDYVIKTIDRKGSSPFFADQRARTGTFGENMDLMYEYIIYVNKQDYDKAYSLI